ncbi:hypothetical protein BHE74_00055833, partial [Ensete ventricosum]
MQEEEEKRRRKVKKGSLTVTVGTEVEAGGFRRFVIPISYLYHPLFAGLLDSARDTYGFRSSGPLALPCSVDDFLHLRWLIERERQPSVSALAGGMRERLIGCSSGRRLMDWKPRRSPYAGVDLWSLVELQLLVVCCDVWRGIAYP